MSAEIADELRAKANSSFDRLATISELMLRAAAALDAKDKRIAELTAGGWQPIETAPADVFVLLCSASKRQFVGRWVENVRWFEDYRRRPIGSPADGPWTGWQPLPAPPSSLPNKEDRNG